MKRYTNKHWIKEKEFISLIREMDFLYKLLPRYKWRVVDDSRISHIERELYDKFYYRYLGKYKSAPKWYRKMLNRKQRHKSNNTLYKQLNNLNVSYEDNYKDSGWYW